MQAMCITFKFFIMTTNKGNCKIFRFFLKVQYLSNNYFSKTKIPEMPPIKDLIDKSSLLCPTRSLSLSEKVVLDNAALFIVLEKENEPST